MNDLLHAIKAVDVAALTGARIVFIVVVAWALSAVFRRLLRLVIARFVSRLDDIEAIKRAETLNRVLRHGVTVLASLVAGILILAELGISVTPILGAAGIVGIAVGFGAQSLVKDYFAGFSLLIENQIRQGDVVDVAGKSGLVEEITLRYVRLRDYQGNVHFVPNGLITTVTNRSRGFAHAVIDIGIGFSEDVDAVFEVMRRVAADLTADTQFAGKILGPLEIAGVESLANPAVMIRCRIKVTALEQDPVRREYLRRLKRAFDSAGIEIPFPQLTVQSGRANNRAVAGAEPAPTSQP